MIHGSWNIRWNRQKLLSFSAIFCPFNPLTTRKIKILKLKQTPADIIILHISTINNNHMIHGSWDMDHDRHNFLSFWTVFGPFTPYESRQSKLWKDDKNTWRYYHFTNVYHKRQSYDVWFLRYRVQRTEFFVILDSFLPFKPPNNPKNQNCKKMKKQSRDIVILHMCTINDNHMTGVDTGCFWHRCTDFGHTNLGMPKFNLKQNWN